MFPAFLFKQLRCIELLMTEIASNKEKGVKNSFWRKKLQARNRLLNKEITSGEDLYTALSIW